MYLLRSKSKIKAKRTAICRPFFIPNYKKLTKLIITGIIKLENRFFLYKLHQKEMNDYEKN